MRIFPILPVSEKVQILIEQYKPILENAIQANHSREFFAQYPEAPSPKVYGETANDDGKAKMTSQIRQNFDRLNQKCDEWMMSDETSPFMMKRLGISYPVYKNLDSYIKNAHDASKDWKHSSAEVRAAVLIDSLERIKLDFFEIAYATMHTTGQAFMMSFQASGPHANDRALEAIAMGYEALKAFPQEMVWDKPMGKINVTLKKYFRAIPKGISLAIGCSTFPIWNTVPGVYAALMTGNPVIVKPHPMGIYPLAIVVARIRETLSANGFNPDLIQLAADNSKNMITKTLAEHPSVKMIDYTGGSSFGDYIEALPNKITFTEKAGVNSAILDSTDNYKEMLNNLSFSVNLYSGQMCTCPQNFFVSKNGIQTPEGLVSYEQFSQDFCAAIKGLATNEKAGPAVLGAIQNPMTADRIEKVKNLGGKVLLDSIKIPNPEFPEARMASPIVIEVPSDKKDIFTQELFGPIVLLIPTSGLEESVQLASSIATEHGAISCATYCTSEAGIEMIAEKMADAATPVSFNLAGPIYVNQNASFSDFHVSGGNPAGNASFTDAAFVTRRFNWIGFRVPVQA